ncbi:unnamed protein product, partial [Dovyalis caffra]
MADHQKVHPLNTSSSHDHQRSDVEAPQAPTVPLVPRGSSKSDNGDPSSHDQQYYPPFQRTIPFSIDSLQITRFNLSNNSSLSAAFDVTITARNPNKKVGIYYEGGSHISVWYTGTNLCQGSLPKFYQGHRNTTVLNVLLSGQTNDGNTLLTSLQQQQQQTGIIPLNLRATQPVRIKLGKLKLMKVKFRVRCKLDVDSLAANNAINIRNSS